MQTEDAAIATRGDVDEDPRWQVPKDFVSAIAPVEKDGSSVYLLTGKSGIPLNHLVAIGERMGVEVSEREDGHLLIRFPVYDDVIRLHWCTAVRTLAIAADVEWPHLELPR